MCRAITSLEDEGKHWVIIRLKELRLLRELYKNLFSATVAYNSLTFLIEFQSLLLHFNDVPMKSLSDRLIVAGVSVCVAFVSHTIVVASGEGETGVKLVPPPSDRYLPQTPVSPRGYIWPSQGNLTSGYGIRFGRLHPGVDIAAAIGTPIVAAASGVVVFAGWSDQGLGYKVSIRHPDGNVSIYGHNQRLLVTSGQKVEQGQQIAEMGSTGFSTGPHLHFEIRPGGRKGVDPMAFLPSGRPTLTPEQAELVGR